LYVLCVSTSLARGSFCDSSCHQLCTVVLSFLPYTTGKQQLDEEMPQIWHFHFINCSQRDNRFTTYYVFGQSYTTYYTSGQLFWGVFYHIEIIAKNVEFYNFVD